MEIIGYICAMLVGVSLGLLGSGGSILTVPIMVYLMNINPVEATGLSLFAVGVTSAVGVMTYLRRKLVDVQTALIFAIPSVICVFLTRKFLMPAIPNPLFSSGTFTLSKELFIMLLFAVLMVMVGYRMIRQSDIVHPETGERHFHLPGLISIGLVSGLLTGLLGVGGGFIIIPALVLFAKIDIRMSVGTSLLIIALNSFIGFIEEATGAHDTIDYRFLFWFSLLSVTGIFIGFLISLKLQAAQLKKLFGWFLLVIGVYVFVRELLRGIGTS